MQTRTWNLIFIAGYVIFSWIRIHYGRRTRKNVKTVRRVDALEKALLALLSLLSLSPFLYLFTTWLAFADYRLPAFAPWCGTALMMASLWLFYRAHADLGQNWSVTLEIRQEHRLVTQGVYRSIRYPMYASFWIWSFAQGLMLNNWVAGWSFLVGFLPMYFLRVPREERMLSESFG